MIPDVPLTAVQVVGLWGLVISIICVALLIGDHINQRNNQHNPKEHQS